MARMLSAGEVFTMESLVSPGTGPGISSRVLARTVAGNITLFAFAAGQQLSEHTTPFDALALTLSGSLTLTIAGVPVQTAPLTFVLLPADLPHAVSAAEPSRMLLIMLREAPPAGNAPGGPA